MSVPLSQISRLVVARSLVEEGHALLREEGDKGHEALIVWAGRAREEAQTVFDVEAMLMPRQYAYVAEREVAVVVDGDAIFEMNVLLNEHGMRLIAQLHTHPSRAYHSDTDDLYSLVTAEGGVSIVVPDFAYGAFDLGHVAVYRLHHGEWKQLGGKNVTEFIQIAEDY